MIVNCKRFSIYINIFLISFNGIILQSRHNQHPLNRWKAVRVCQFYLLKITILSKWVRVRILIISYHNHCSHSHAMYIYSVGTTCPLAWLYFPPSFSSTNFSFSFHWYFRPENVNFHWNYFWHHLYWSIHRNRPFIFIKSIQFFNMKKSKNKIFLDPIHYPKCLCNYFSHTFEL